LRLFAMYGIYLDVARKQVLYRLVELSSSDSAPVSKDERRLLWAYCVFTLPFETRANSALVNSNSQLIDVLQGCQDLPLRALLRPISEFKFSSDRAQTPFHNDVLSAIKWKNLAYMQLSLEAGKNPFFINGYGETVFDLAVANKDVLDCLVQYAEFNFTRKHAQWYGPYFCMRARAFLLVVLRLKILSRDTVLHILRCLARIEAK